MKKLKLGSSGEELSTIGLGTWVHGGGDYAFGWGAQDDRESIASIKAAVEVGINWIDTAPVYGLGHSEEVLGQALKELPERPFIATKCGLRWDDATRKTYSLLKADSIRAECEASLRRLGVDVIDLYQIHWPKPDEEIEEGWGAVADLVKEGKVRFGGVSNFSVDQMKRAQEIHPITSLQPPYSMLERNVESDILDFCSQHDIGVIAYSPLQKGLLTGKIDHTYVEDMDDDDHRKAMDPKFRDPELSKILGKVEKLKVIAERLGLTMTQLAVAWVLLRPEITAAIVGARRSGQIRDVAPASEVKLPEESVVEIEEVLSEV